MITLTKDKFMSEEELQHLSRVLNLGRMKDSRDSLMIELALKSGAREGELIMIQVSDLDVKAGTVFIQHAEKGSSKREVPLDREFMKRLTNYAQGREGRLFPISTSRVRQIWMSIRPVNKKFHSLRHTFGRQVYRKTKDILKVQYLLGHKSLSNTSIYTMEDYESDHLRKAMGL